MVSVIVPIYNRENTLQRCLDSLCQQTYRDIEILLINDGSTDRSREICESYAKTHEYIRVFNRKNGGVSAARNIGLAHMRGEYYTFVDADDTVAPQMVEKLVRAMETDGSDAVICGHIMIKDGVEEIRVPQDRVLQSQEEIVRFVAEQYEDNYLPMAWAKLYKKELTDFEFKNDMFIGEDFAFNILYFAKAEKLSLISNPLYYYFNISTNGSLTHSYKEGYYESMRMLYQMSAAYVQGYDLSLVAYHFYKSAIAFLVTQIMCGYDRAQQLTYLKKICDDEVFQVAVSQVNTGQPADRIMQTALPHHQYAVVLTLARLRAKQKKMQRRKLSKRTAAS